MLNCYTVQTPQWQNLVINFNTQRKSYMLNSLRTFALSSGDQGLAYVPLCKHCWCLDIVPVLLRVRVDTTRTGMELRHYKWTHDLSQSSPGERRNVVSWGYRTPLVCLWHEYIHLHLFLGALLALSQSFILAHSHLVYTLRKRTTSGHVSTFSACACALRCATPH